MGLGIGIGNAILFYNASIAAYGPADFQARVLADGGTYEANQCLVNIINELSV